MLHLAIIYITENLFGDILISIYSTLYKLLERQKKRSLACLKKNYQQTFYI